ncbi:MAG: NADH-quinone oxidoreductase subunit J [Anaerolineales bacterium]
MALTPELVVFFILAAVSVGAAVGMLASRSAVHSALFLVLNFAVVSVFFLMLAAPFIAMVQVTVYAGAIMVLFLFVIMLLGAEMLRHRSQVLPWQPILAFVLGALFVAVLAYVTFFKGGYLLASVAPPAFPEELVAEFGGPASIGLVLYRNYLLPFELTSFLLLVAMIGAVVLTRDNKGRQVDGTYPKTAATERPARG